MSAETASAPYRISGDIAALQRIFLLTETWLSARIEWIVWLVTLAAFYLRFTRASALYFNGDEAMILFAPLQHGISGVYRALLVHPHGPFPNFLLYFMSWFGNSELYFRMPFVLAGSLLPYVAYRWTADLFGKGPGLITACIVGFSPAMVILSAQTRFYMIQILFLACALYGLERAFRDRSIVWMRLFGVCSVMALMSEYSSVLCIMALGVYALVRIVRRELPRRLILEWAGTQVTAAVLLIAVYFIHLRPLAGSPGERFAQEVWLRSSYYHPGADEPLKFFSETTTHLFEYVFSNPESGMWAVAVFAIGIALILWGKGGTPQAPRLTAISLLLPFLFTAATAFLSLYPYGGSRHDAFLALFVAAGVAPAVSFVARGKIVVLVAAAAFSVHAWMDAADQQILDDVPAVSKVEQMNRALEYLGTRSPQPRVLVVDQLGSVTLNYYVCRGQLSDWRKLPDNLTTYHCGGYQILAVDTWGAAVSSFPGILQRARLVQPDLFTDPAWAFSISFERRTDQTLTLDGAAWFGKLEFYRLPPQAR